MRAGRYVSAMSHQREIAGGVVRAIDIPGPRRRHSMARHLYPAILHPADPAGLHGVVVPGININASDGSAGAAIADAAAMLQEVIDDLAAAGAEIPCPLPFEQLDAAGGSLVLLPASPPTRSSRSPSRWMRT